jgi:hypothetical protein
LHIEHKSTTDFDEADALSRLIANHTTPENTYVVAAVTTDDVDQEVQTILLDQTSKLPVSVNDMKTASLTDQTLKTICAFINEGWPE